MRSMTLEEAATYRLDHWRERWRCHPLCTAAGPFGPHNARCTAVEPPDHPAVGLLQRGWR